MRPAIGNASRETKAVVQMKGRSAAGWRWSTAVVANAASRIAVAFQINSNALMILLLLSWRPRCGARSGPDHPWRASPRRDRARPQRHPLPILQRMWSVDGVVRPGAPRLA